MKPRPSHGESGQKRDRTKENVQRSLRRIMRRLDRIRKAHGVDFYFCARYRKFYEYMSSPHFRPSAREIVGSSPPSTAQILTIAQDENYPLSERKTLGSFTGHASPSSSGNSNNDSETPKEVSREQESRSLSTVGQVMGVEMSTRLW